MTKLEITNVQIDNYNDTNNQLNKFDSGLNIVCGSNEAGKSTLMKFIKNIFVREKSDAKGYVKCSYNGKEFKLTPDNLKENEQYLEDITAHSFKTGFVIDLDDLIYAKSSDSEELVNVIKDSSGNAINSKQKEYHDGIYSKKQKFCLSSTNKHSKQFSQQFDNLKNIETKIKELETKEDEYNNLCLELEQIKNDIKQKEFEQKTYGLLLDKLSCENTIKNIKINEKLLENKTALESIREDFGAYNVSLKKALDLNKKLEELKEKFETIWNKLNKLENFDEEKLEQFECSIENLKKYKSILEKENDLNKTIKELTELIENKKEAIENFENQKKSTKTKLNNLNISNFEKYINDKQLLESYLNDYSKLIDNLRNSGENINQNKSNTLNILLLLFLGILFSSMGTLLMFNSKELLAPMFSVILVCIVGVSSVLREKFISKNNVKNNYNTAINHNKNEIIKILNNYNFEQPKTEDFVVKINSYILKMNNNISDYKIIENELNSLETNLEKERKNLDTQQEKNVFLNKNLSNNNNDKEEFIKTNSVENFENYEEIFELIKECKQIKEQEKEIEAEIKTTETIKETFVTKVNEYIELCELSIQKINKYEENQYEETIKILQNSYDENYKNNLFVTERKNEITNINEQLEQFEINIEQENIDEQTIEITKQELQNLIETRAVTQQKIEELKQVSGISGLRTQKQTELNKIKLGINNLIIKELVYNIIEKSKEKFNETQPNLVSAKEYLSKITNGKYTEIDFENKTISGENIAEKSWDNLSRGTKEQLYLAFRLGYANNYSKDKDGNPNGLANIPLIIDDAFVNFDKERTNSILKCLEEFSKNNQVIYFTCHNDMTKEILKSSKIKHNLIEL